MPEYTRQERQSCSCVFNTHGEMKLRVIGVLASSELHDQVLVVDTDDWCKIEMWTSSQTP